MAHSPSPQKIKCPRRPTYAPWCFTIIILHITGVYQNSIFHTHILAYLGGPTFSPHSPFYHAEQTLITRLLLYLSKNGSLTEEGMNADVWGAETAEKEVATHPFGQKICSWWGKLVKILGKSTAVSPSPIEGNYTITAIKLIFLLS